MRLPEQGEPAYDDDPEASLLAQYIAQAYRYREGSAALVAAFSARAFAFAMAHHRPKITSRLVPPSLVDMFSLRAAI